MATFQRTTRIRAPFEAVWRFHSTVDGFRAVTPDWLHLRVHAIDYPDGADADGGELVPGTRLRLSVRPFGVGPRQEWVSEITARAERADEAFFTDEMRQGPFRRWRHTHRVRRADGDALLRDEIEYESPLGAGADALGRPALAAAFRDRHRRTRNRLE